MKDQIQKFLAYHHERIYFSLKYDMKFFKQLANELSEYSKQDTYSLFKIDLNKHPHHLCFFLDPAYSYNDVYTLENISPDCITKIAEI